MKYNKCWVYLGLVLIMYWVLSVVVMWSIMHKVYPDTCPEVFPYRTS